MKNGTFWGTTKLSSANASEFNRAKIFLLVKDLSVQKALEILNQSWREDKA